MGIKENPALACRVFLNQIVSVRLHQLDGFRDPGSARSSNPLSLNLGPLAPERYLMSTRRTPEKVNDKFDAALGTLVAAEMAHACDIGDCDRAAAAIEVQMRSLALSIAVAARGEPTAMNDLLEGVSQHLFEEAARFSTMGRLLGMKK
jgi:hypothetical protein